MQIPDLQAEGFYENTCHFGQFLPALLLLPCACSNSGGSDKLPPMQIQGVNVDIPQLSAQSAQAPAELQGRVTEGVAKVRLKQYPQGMMVFDEILNSPGVNDKQKAILTRVLGQLEEVVSKAPGQGSSWAVGEMTPEGAWESGKGRIMKL